MPEISKFKLLDDVVSMRGIIYAHLGGWMIINAQFTRLLEVVCVCVRVMWKNDRAINILINKKTRAGNMTLNLKL